MNTLNTRLSFRTTRLAAPLLLLALAACSTTPPAAQAGHCYQSPNRMRAPLCSTAALPSEAAAREASSFAGDPQALTVYVIRRSWGDAVERVSLSTAQTTEATLLPKTWARLRLAPGQVALQAQWAGGSARTTVSGPAGAVRFVELTGKSWSWGSDFHFEDMDAQAAHGRAEGLRLVADLSSGTRR
jgi:hypothetical protein